MAHLFIFGLGYTAKRIAARAETLGWRVDATGSDGNFPFHDDDRFEEMREVMGRATHILSSVPPETVTGGDDVLYTYSGRIEAAVKRGAFVGYLSSSGVYGDTGGAWVDESAPTGGGRRTARSDADARWLELGAHVFRLPGIYGPGRSAFDRIASGKAHRIDLPDQVFSRVHVEDIASGVVAAMEGDAPPGAYNLSDDLPASQNAVIEEACRIAGLPLPPMQSLDEAGLSELARGFYMENRRVANGRAKRVLGWQPRYPTYREGLAAISRADAP